MACARKTRSPLHNVSPVDACVQPLRKERRRVGGRFGRCVACGREQLRTKTELSVANGNSIVPSDSVPSVCQANIVGTFRQPSVCTVALRTRAVAPLRGGCRVARRRQRRRHLAALASLALLNGGSAARWRRASPSARRASHPAPWRTPSNRSRNRHRREGPITTFDHGVKEMSIPLM